MTEAKGESKVGLILLVVPSLSLLRNPGYVMSIIRQFIQGKR